MFKKMIATVGLLSLSITAHAAVATTSTYAGTSTSISNCIPFGCPDVYGPDMGFIYKDIAAFSLKAGDVIAFDTGARNDLQLSFDLSLGSTTVNGGTTFNRNALKLVSTLPTGNYGDAIVGNYDIAFVANTTFNFAGGGLVASFYNANGAVNDTSYEQNLVWSNNNPYTVGRFFSDGGEFRIATSPSSVGNLRIITKPAEVPEPGSLAMIALGVAAMGLRRRSKAS